MTHADREAIRQRAEKSSDGPWYVEAKRPGHDHDARVYGRGSWGVCKPTGQSQAQREADAEFIANARKDIPALLAALDALEAERDDAKSDFTALMEHHQATEQRSVALEAERDRLREARDVIFDLVDVCYTEGTSASWKLCQVCDMEYRPDEARPGDQTHQKGCVVDVAERWLRVAIFNGGTQHQCIACPVEVRALYAVAFNLLNLRDDPDRWQRKIHERLNELQSAVSALTPIVDKHFNDPPLRAALSPSHEPK